MIPEDDWFDSRALGYLVQKIVHVSDRATHCDDVLTKET
jgi:hypothetical protein